MNAAMPSAICVDSSVWIEHFKGKTTRLQLLLNNEPFLIRTHDLIVVELALGGMAHKQEKISLIRNLEHLPNVTADELLVMIQTHDLSGKGIGCVDCNILASCLLSDTLLWTYDKKLSSLAGELGLLYER